MLLYDYQYDVAALLVGITILIIYFLRKSYSTKSIKVLIWTLICDMAAAAFDAVSIFAISFPERYSHALTWTVSLGYLFFYNTMSVMYFLYVDSKTRIPAFRKPARVISIITEIYFFISIILSPWTHMVAYFDENMGYHHGPLMAALYVIPFIYFILDFVMIYKARKKFNRYQTSACVFFLVMMASGVVIQTIFPRLLVGQLFCAVIMFFVYVAFENPAYYTYMDTQCLNINAATEEMKELRKANTSYTIIVVTLKDFDYMSRTFGKIIAGKISAKVAEHMYKTYGTNAFCIAPDYFMVITSNKERISPIVAELKLYVSQAIELEDNTFSISADVVVIEEPGENFEASDIAEIIGYKLAHPDTSVNVNEAIAIVVKNKVYRENLLHAIQKALANDLFQMYYQPIKNVKTGQFESAEALIRLVDDELGFINPEDLIVTAEANGYIYEIGRIVFEKVCKFISEGGIEKLGVNFIEVNLSTMQFADKNLVEDIFGIMKKYNISSNMINFEITETANLSNEKNMEEAMEQLSDKGIHFSIDDFGSGFASSDWLIKLPVSVVKIDKYILWNAMKDEDAMIVLKNTMRMMQELGKKTVVEGAETDEMVKILEENECDYIQGYYYSKPLPADQYAEFIRDKNRQ